VNSLVRKIAGKHRAALATATAFALLLIAASVASTFLAVRATRAERAAHEQVAIAQAHRLVQPLDDATDQLVSRPNARDTTMSEPQVTSELTQILDALSRGEPQAARPAPGGR